MPTTNVVRDDKGKKSSVASRLFQGLLSFFHFFRFGIYHLEFVSTTGLGISILDLYHILFLYQTRIVEVFPRAYHIATMYRIDPELLFLPFAIPTFGMTFEKAHTYLCTSPANGAFAV